MTFPPLFKMENFIEDVNSLTTFLTNLIANSHGKVKESKFQTCDSLQEFSVCVIPPKTWHPLRRIAGKSSSGFLLVGKSSQDPSTEADSPGNLQLTRYKVERVPVGTPLSQEVFYLSNSEPLQSYSGVRKDESEGKGCVFEWSVSQEQIQPTSLQEARYFLSLYANALRGSLESTELWVCVDGNNTQEVSYLAMVPEAGTKLGNKDTNTPSSVQNFMRHVICTSRKEPISKQEDFPPLSSFMQQHTSSICTAFVETHGYALYEIMGSSCLDNQESERSTITVELTWDGVTSLLQPHPHSCDGVLHIKSVPGSMHLASYTLYLELLRVEEFSLMLENEEYMWPSSTGITVTSVSSQMDAFFSKLSASNMFSPTVKEELEDVSDGEPAFADTTMAHLTTQEFSRNDLDFTERLWLLLKDCIDGNDLITSLEMCTLALFSGKCQPVVHSSNMTSLAVFIRNLLQFETKEEQEKLQNRAREFLNLNSAIECMVEIGTEKLVRDYTQYFIHEELATMGQLSSYLNNEVPLQTRVSNIKKLHQTLELVMTAKSVTKLEHENLRTLAQSALSYYQSHCDYQQPVFSLSLPTFGSTSGGTVKSHCAALNPAIWCAAIKSNTKTTSNTTIIQLSMSQPGNANQEGDNSSYDVTQVNDDEDFDPDKQKFEYFLSCAKQLAMPIIA